MTVSTAANSMVLVLVAVSACWSRLRAEEPPNRAGHVHSFAWRYDKNEPVMFLCDGAEIGRSNVGCAKAREMDLDGTDLVKVEFPKEEAPRAEKVVLPCERNGVIEAWLDKGVKLEFWCAERKLEPIFVSWTCQSWDKPADLVVDGKIICPVTEAASALGKIKITENTLVIVIYPFMDDGNLFEEFPEAIKTAYYRWLGGKVAKGVSLLKRSIWLYPEATRFRPDLPSKPPGMRDVEPKENKK